MSGMDWIKIYTSYVDNPRLAILPEYIQARFFKLYLLAGECDADGVITYTPEETALKLHISLKDLQETIKVLSKTKPVFFCNNGNGLEVPLFREEQTSKETRDKKREDNRKRQEEYRENHKRISNALVSLKSQSQSQSQRKSQSQESEDESSVQETDQQATDDDHSLTDRKADICKHAGIPPEYSKGIIANPEILPEDILAQLTLNYSKKGKVKNPGIITGMNLANVSHERAAAEWYDRNKMDQFLPQALKQKLGFVVQSQEDGLDNCVEVATRIIETPEEKAWQSAIDQLEKDMPHGCFDAWVRNSHLVSYDDGFFTVGVCNSTGKDWLESRVTSTVQRLLMGIMNLEDISVRFVVQEGA